MVDVFLVATHRRRLKIVLVWALVSAAAISVASVASMASADVAIAKSAQTTGVAGSPLFIGTSLGGPLYPSMEFAPQFTEQLDLMAASGVEGIRATFDWAAAQPYRSWSEVPVAERGLFSSDGVDDVPTNFTAIDQLVGEAALRHVGVLPIVIDAPPWDGVHGDGSLIDIPVDNRPFAAFCKVLELRYGPNGTFWTAFPGDPQPIRAWQIWNEPDVSYFWPLPDFAKGYVSLLAAARAAIRAGDPHATIVLAGLANYSWNDLRAIYAVRGARKLFDVVGVHPYTVSPSDVITILERVRRVMRSAGDGRKPMIADEIGWPSGFSSGAQDASYGFVTTEFGQADRLTSVLRLLEAKRAKLGLTAVYYYTWATDERDPMLSFDFSGLLKYDGAQFVPKPAFFAFRHAALTLERCRQKTMLADACAKPF